MTVDVEAVLPVLVQIATLFAALAAGYIGLRKWIARIAAAQQQAAQQIQTANNRLQTTNGTTVAGYVEATAGRLDQISDSLTTLTETAEANRMIAQRAEAIAEATSKRLDEHLLSGHHIKDVS